MHVVRDGGGQPPGALLTPSITPLHIRLVGRGEWGWGSRALNRKSHTHEANGVAHEYRAVGVSSC